MDAHAFVAETLRLQSCGADAFLLELELPAPLPALAPGRFAMICREDGLGPVIPRPFSVYDQPDPRRLVFLVQVIGRGTRILAALRPGDPVTCTVPLGNGFVVAPPGREVVLVAGGIGSAPFLLYARQRLEAGRQSGTTFFFGARSADRLYDARAFGTLRVRTVFSTDDGSAGFHGSVVEAVQHSLAGGGIGRDALFCACGPEGLLHGFAAFAREHALEYELSLETYMGCGFGVCNGCPVPTAPDGPLGSWPWAKACRAGPVFSGSAIRF